MNPTNEFKFRLFGCILSLLLIGCAGSYSIREGIIRSKIPESYKSYSSGIIKNPIDTNVQAAIEFGKSSKEGDELEYAYLIKSSQSALSTNQIYIKVYTPLYLIANHAREQIRDYREVDSSFIMFACNLNAVQIALTQQFTSTVTYNAYAFKRQVILLRNGVRVEPLKEIPAWQGSNPFQKQLDKNTQATIAQTTQSYTRGLVANMTKEQKIALIHSYQTMGFSSNQIIAYTGLTQEEIGELVPNLSSKNGTIALSEYDSIYSIDELNKPGNYEIIFRTPRTSNLVSSGDDEVRINVTFNNFK